MANCCSKDCDCHQNSSFIFGLVFGLIIGALIAILIYKNNKTKVFEDLKKKLSEFISSLKKSETLQNVSKIIDKVDINNSAKISKKHLKKHSKKNTPSAPKKSEPLKKEVVLPQKLIAQNPETKISVSKSKPRVFKK